MSTESRVAMKIAGVPGLLITEVYQEGHPLTASEARALDQTRRENIRNNTKGQVEAVLEGLKKDDDGAVILTDAAVSEIQEFITKYSAEYHFGQTSGRASKVDPVTKKARELILPAVTKMLAKHDVKVSGLKTAELNTYLDEALAKHLNVVDIARKQIAATAKALGDLEL